MFCFTALTLKILDSLKTLGPIQAPGPWGDTGVWATYRKTDPTQPLLPSLPPKQSLIFSASGSVKASENIWLRKKLRENTAAMTRWQDREGVGGEGF